MRGAAPWKIHMEPDNHRVVEENRLPKVHFSGSMLIFWGVHIQSLTTVAKNAPFEMDDQCLDIIMTFSDFLLRNPYNIAVLASDAVGAGMLAIEMSFFPSFLSSWPSEPKRKPHPPRTCSGGVHSSILCAFCAYHG